MGDTMFVGTISQRRQCARGGSSKTVAAMVVVLLLTSTLMLVPGTNAASGIDVDLLGYWSFDEGDGDDINDESGNGRHGTRMGPEWTDGQRSKALEFDGTDDYVEIPNEPELNPIEGVSAGAWFRWSTEPQAGISFATIISMGDGRFTLSHSGNVDSPYKNAYLEFTVQTNEFLRTVRSTSRVQGDIWYHVVGAYDYYSEELKIYVNGELENSTYLRGTVMNGGLDLNIGCHPTEDGRERFFNGTIDEAFYYGRGLMDWEAMFLYSDRPSKVPMPDLRVLPQDLSVIGDAEIGKSVSVRMGVSDSAGDTRTWQKHLESPFLGLGGPGQFDNVGVTHPTVVLRNDTYHMWYEGYDGTLERIGHAISFDGVAWQKQGLSLDTGITGSYDEFGASFPSVVVVDGTIRLWYTAWSIYGSVDGCEIGYATSRTGAGWNKLGTLSGDGTWDSAFIMNPTVQHDGSIYHMWYQGGDGDGSTYLGYATSEDAMTWTMHGRVKVNNDYVEGEARVLISADTYTMWFMEDGRMRQATSTDGLNWRDQEVALSVGSSGRFDQMAISVGSVIWTSKQLRMWYGGRSGPNSTIGYAYLLRTATVDLVLYDGDPEEGGSWLGDETVSVWGNLTTYAKIQWRPIWPGSHELYVVLEDAKPGDQDDSNDMTTLNVEVLGESTTPSEPRLLEAEGGLGRVDLTWQAPNHDGGSPITGYSVYRRLEVGEWTFLDNVTGGTSFVDFSVDANTTYQYTVRAVNALGEGPSCEMAQVTTTDVPEAVLDPKDFEALDYTDPTDDDYQVHIEGAEGSSRSSYVYGVSGTNASMDIRRLDAEYDQSVGQVVIRLEMGAEPATDTIGAVYSVAFVAHDHTQRPGLLDPRELTADQLESGFPDEDKVVARLDLKGSWFLPTLSTTPSMWMATAEVKARTVLYTVPAQDLVDAGLEKGSGFGLYAYCHVNESGTMPTGDWYHELVWDSAGLGAGNAPGDIRPETFTAEDFAGLSYTDPRGDDYTISIEGMGLDPNFDVKGGLRDREPDADIVGLTATYDVETGKVEVTLTLEGIISFDPFNVTLVVAFVEDDHRFTGPYLDPEDLGRSGEKQTFYDENATIVMFSVTEDPFWGSGTYPVSDPAMRSLGVTSAAHSVTFTMDAEELRKLGLRSGSGFGLYAFYQKTDSRIYTTMRYEMDMSWDTVGVGSVGPPREFGEGAGGGGLLDDLTSGPMLFVLLIVVVAAVAGVGAVMVMRRRKGRPEGEEQAPEVETEGQAPEGPGYAPQVPKRDTYCEGCGTYPPIDATECPTCGAELPPLPSQEPPPARRPPEAPPEEGPLPEGSPPMGAPPQGPPPQGPPPHGPPTPGPPPRGMPPQGPPTPGPPPRGMPPQGPPPQGPPPRGMPPQGPPPQGPPPRGMPPQGPPQGGPPPPGRPPREGPPRDGGPTEDAKTEGSGMGRPDKAEPEGDG